MCGGGGLQLSPLHPETKTTRRPEILRRHRRLSDPRERRERLQPDPRGATASDSSCRPRGRGGVPAGPRPASPGGRLQRAPRFRSTSAPWPQGGKFVSNNLGSLGNEDTISTTTSSHVTAVGRAADRRSSPPPEGEVLVKFTVALSVTGLGPGPGRTQVGGCPAALHPLRVPAVRPGLCWDRHTHGAQGLSLAATGGRPGRAELGDDARSCTDTCAGSRVACGGHRGVRVHGVLKWALSPWGRKTRTPRGPSSGGPHPAAARATASEPAGGERSGSPWP